MLGSLEYLSLAYQEGQSSYLYQRKLPVVTKIFPKTSVHLFPRISLRCKISKVIVIWQNHMWLLSKQTCDWTLSTSTTLFSY